MLDELLPKGSARRQVAAVAGATVLLLLVTQFVMPGEGARGTPGAILFQGLVFGALNALTAMGIVLIYRTSRILNFAQAGLGAIGAMFAYNTIIVFGLPYGIAFAVAVILSAVLAVALELAFVRRFFEAPRLVLTIVTIGFLLLISGPGLGLVIGLPLWGEGRDPIEAAGATPVNPLPSIEFTVGNLQIPFGFGELFALVVAVVALLGIGAFLRYSRMGVAVRASSENSERAELLGINVKVLSTVVWAIAGALSGAGVTLYGTVNSFAIGGQGAPEVLLVAFAAAVIARMYSLPIAVFGAVAISIMEAALRWSFPGQQGLFYTMVFGVLAVGLLLQRKALQRGEEASSWEATEEIRPTPREMFTVPGVRLWRFVLLAVGIGAVLIFPWLATVGVINLAGQAAIVAMVLLSLVVLTGWAGQVSLAQFAFVAVGAVVGGAIMGRAEISFWLAVPAAAVITGAVATGVGLPALRIKGLFLAVVTFAFAATTFFMLFNERYFGWLLPESVPRPTLLLLDFDDERSMFYLLLVFLGVTVAAVLGLRRTRPGRVLIAMRENETELQSFGINVLRTKLAAFALSGFLCGMAGALFASHQRAISATSFEPQASIEMFVFVVIGGISSISGGLIGAGLWAVKQVAPGGDAILAFFFNEAFLILVVLWVVPGGVAAIVYGLRDSVLRIVAQRRQMVVPSLFADYDPATLERQLIPLGEGMTGAGLQSLPFDRRYRLRSELYGAVNGETTAKHAPDDSKALGAAAERASEGA